MLKTFTIAFLFNEIWASLISGLTNKIPWKRAALGGSKKCGKKKQITHI